MMKKLLLLMLFPSLALASTFFVIIDPKESNYISGNSPSDGTEQEPENSGIYVVERTKLSNGGYTIWSDGYIEQWGYKAPGDDQIVFPVPFTEASTISFVIQEYVAADQYGRQPTTLPTTTGVYDFYRSDLEGTWMVEGY